MAQVVGTVVSVSLETDVAKNGGGSYKGWELVYKTQDGKVQTIAKPVTGLRFNAPLKAALGTLEAGDTFTLTQEKNAQGFNDVKEIVKGNVLGEVKLSAPPKPNSPSNSYQQRDYETKEERQRRQELIVRQSSLTNAIETLSVGAKSVTPQQVMEVAQQYVDFVFARPVQNLEDDIPV